MDKAADFQKFRSALQAAVKRAHAEYENERGAYTTPHASQTAVTRFNEARGRWFGLAEALELLDKEGQE